MSSSLSLPVCTLLVISACAHDVRCVAPGDAAVGKSSLLVRLTDQRFLANPDPTVRALATGSRIQCLATDVYRTARC